MDMADIAEEVAADATKLLSDEYGCWAIREEGREDPYGFDARDEEKAQMSNISKMHGKNCVRRKHLVNIYSALPQKQFCQTFSAIW